MTIQRAVARVVRSRVHNATALRWLHAGETALELLRNSASSILPIPVGPSPRNLTVAITAKCNLRCVGCRYGRDYMPGHELTTGTVKELLRDAASAGISTVRLYGGEPLLHPGLSEMIETAVILGMNPYVSTNGRLLERRLGGLFAAGLRSLSFGYYGCEDTYDEYVQRQGAWTQFERGLATARERYQEQLTLHVCYVLNTRTCSLTELEKAWALAVRYNLVFHIDLVHYSLPYFSEGPDRELQFKPSDLPRIHRFVHELKRLKAERPDLYSESVASINSIPDWLMRGPAMRVPCDAYDMIWVGADGSVRLCFVTFPLGNLHEQPLRDLLFTAEHRRAAAGAVHLDCPNCHCHRESRIVKHLPSLVRYQSRAGRTPGYAGPVNGAVLPIVGQDL